MQVVIQALMSSNVMTSAVLHATLQRQLSYVTLAAQARETWHKLAELQVGVLHEVGASSL